MVGSQGGVKKASIAMEILERKIQIYIKHHLYSVHRPEDTRIDQDMETFLYDFVSQAIS
jgi:hypothetical protein